jgi:hypothetical protein
MEIYNFLFGRLFLGHPVCSVWKCIRLKNDSADIILAFPRESALIFIRTVYEIRKEALLLMIISFRAKVKKSELHT